MYQAFDTEGCHKRESEMTEITPWIAAKIATAGWNKATLRAALVAHGFAVDDQEARIAVKRIKAIRQERAERQRRADPLVMAAGMRAFKLRQIREERRNRDMIAQIMSAPMAAFWRSDRRDEAAACRGADMAAHHAVKATLEAVVRLATTRWGFTRRHTSKSSGSADSRYLTLDGVGEVRISDHVIPVYGERAWRYEQNGGPRWGEIVIGRDELTWTPTRWRRELILRAAGRR